jgi:sugar O-acyltransferase (sialic acid O-acetyltransferase NeuD family)
MADRIAIFGCGRFGREILSSAQQLIGMCRAMNSSAFDDDYRERAVVFVQDAIAEPVLGVEVIATDQLDEQDELIIAVGDPTGRRQVAERLGRIPRRSLFADTVIIGPEVEIGEGAVLCDYTMVAAGSRIGKQFQCHTHSYVAPDCVIGDYVTFAAGVRCNGWVHIRDGAYIGTGAVFREGSPGKPLVVGEGAIVGTGAVVIDDVPAGATVVGSPARVQ